MTLPDGPRSLRNPAARAARRTMLYQPHVERLNELAADLRRRLSAEVPDFDPLDGGIGARVLFLFEKPGPMTSPTGTRIGSGFVSRDNDDATAEATYRFLEDGALRRGETVIWNVIPWWDGHISFTGTDRARALTVLERLLAPLPSVDTVVLVGRTAARARAHLPASLRVLESAHPSPKVRATNRAMWDQILNVWALAARGSEAPE